MRIKKNLIDMSRLMLANPAVPLSALRPPLPFIGCGLLRRAWRDMQRQAGHPAN
jgi:uracil-DNA glycosylase